MSGRRSDSKRRHSRLDSEGSPNKRYRRDEYGKEREGVTNVQNEAPLAKHNKPNHPTQVPTSLSYFQHDERGGAGQVGQSSGQRKASERGWWKDTKNELNEREREQRDEKSEAKLNDNTLQRRKDDPPPSSRKGPAFRETGDADRKHFADDRASRGRQGYRPGNGKTQTDKWKHDLYQGVNKDPIPQNEDDQIAKLEALLAP